MVGWCNYSRPWLVLVAMVGVGVIIVGHVWCWCIGVGGVIVVGHGWCWCNYSRPWLVLV